MKKDILDIINYAIKKADPYDATFDALKRLEPVSGRLFVFSIGKAAASMAKAAADFYKDKITYGLAVTKYGYAKDFSSPYFKVIEAAHPIGDENSIRAAEAALDISDKTKKGDTCLVLLSGGGSALFEKSIVPPDVYKDITKKLLSRGAPIKDINAIRRCFSLVKGGKLAEAMYPAKVVTVALSDVLDNDISTIASGITVPNSNMPTFVEEAAARYLPEYRNLVVSLSKRRVEYLINDGGYYIIGDINLLCRAAEERAAALGYSVTSLPRTFNDEARYQAMQICDMIPREKGKHAYIGGGETTVVINGSGTGGRNQEMALGAALALRGKKGILFASVDSDGTDGPTDAAGGMADGETFSRIKKGGVNPVFALIDNDAYHALKVSDDLIFTGPTGTNVNDLVVVLTDR